MPRVSLVILVCLTTLRAWPGAAAGSLTGPSVVPGTATASIATGWSHSCAIRADGTLACWGQTNSGSLHPPSGTFTQVTAGADFSCGLRTEGTIACWGARAHVVNAPSGSFTAIASSQDFSCGIRTEGPAACWGHDIGGSTVPPANTGFRRVAVGHSHACGIKMDGAVECWGSNGRGERSVPAGSYLEISAGDGFTCLLDTSGGPHCFGNGHAATSPPFTSLKSIASYAHHTCGVRYDGRAVCWGHDIFGETVAPAGTFLDVGAGNSFSCGIKTDGSLTCWGPSRAAVTTHPDGTYSHRAASAASNDACDIRLDGTLLCWGLHAGTPAAGAFTQLDIADEYGCAVGSEGRPSCWGNVPAATPTFPMRHAVTSAYGAACGLLATSDIFCWGSDPALKAGLIGTFQQIATKTSSACALRTDSGIGCWARFDTTVMKTKPSGLGYRSVTVGDDHACAIKENSTVQCWGASGLGQLRVPPGTFKQLSAGPFNTCGVRTDGTLACWGTFTEPPAGTFTQVSHGGFNTFCAVRSEGPVACWGDNKFGQVTPPANQ